MGTEPWIAKPVLNATRPTATAQVLPDSAHPISSQLTGDRERGRAFMTFATQSFYLA